MYICTVSYTHLSSWFNNVEIMHKGVNKGEALKALINYLGIDKDEVIAFGDNYNDLPMLELAGIGVVMGNANDEVKELSLIHI